MEKELEEAEAEGSEARAKAARTVRQLRRETRELRRRQQEAKEEEEAEQTYVVQSGDTLSKIAKEKLGDASRWPEIFEANKDKIEDPNLIYPGQELDLPS